VCYDTWKLTMTQHSTIKIHAFHAGHIITKKVRFFGPNGAEENRDIAIPNTCYLISHPNGLVMWDAGLADPIADRPGHTLTRGKFRFTLDRTLAGQLLEIGVASEEVRYLAISHLHIDHTGNSSLFKNATVVLQETEYRLGFGPQAADHGYHLEDYADLAQHTQWLLRGDQDLFGDGRVVLLSAPGHTPGHQVLFVDLADAGSFLLSGDLYYRQSDIEGGWMPVWNQDREITRQSMQRLEDFRLARSARWIVNHDPDRQGIVTAGGCKLSIDHQMPAA
jgi:glyoxylase-like metal-dependent hydrolase (beta-lactamase superfamily II)